MKFRHYIITRFNLGAFDPDVKRGRILRDQSGWMNHRMNLFFNITLPSMMNQTCQNFTWLVLMDKFTPDQYILAMQQIRYQNMKLLFTTGSGLDNKVIARAVLENIVKGNYDLITTRLDNDDAFNRDTVRTIQKWYAPQPDKWAMTFPNGLILDLTQSRLYPMIYTCNNCPTMIERANDAGTIHQCPHTELPVKMHQQIVDSYYWLMVTHSRNIANSLTNRNSSKIIYTEKPIDLDSLRAFGINPGGIIKMKDREKQLTEKC